MSDVEESTGPVRKTRSGRAVKTPAKPKSATAKPASRKTRKKVVVMEVEVTDDEEVEQTEESEPVGKKAKLDEDKLLEASSDNEETDENNKTEEALLNSGDETEKKSKGPELIMNDIAMLEEIMHTNEKITEKVQEAEESETEEAKKTVDEAEQSCATAPAAREKKENGVSEEEKSEEEEETIDKTEEIEKETPEVKEAEEKKPKLKKTADKNPKVKEPEEKKAEENKSEETPTVKKSEEKKPQVKEPEKKKPEVKETGEKKPEVKKAEVKTPEVKEPEQKKPEVKEPDQKKPEVKEPEQKKPEVKEPEQKKPEVKEPEQKKPELDEPEEEKVEVKEPGVEKPEEKETPEKEEENIPEVNEPEEKKPEVKEPEKKKLEVKEPKKENPDVKIETVKETTPVEALLNDSDVEMKEIEAEVKEEVKAETEVKEEVKAETEIKAKVKAQNGEPEAENISDDELPGVPVVKVPETEEVSDEELPGPKRAELPADTEVVSEDELPANTKKDAEEEEAASPSKKEGGKRKLSEGDYDPTSPTSESEAPAKKTKEDKEDKDKEADAAKAKPKKLPELDKYWKAVNDDPTDFTGWTYLLQYVDQENDMEAAREAYDAFLSHYPYCYGYWRKYADYEKKKGNKKKCEEVFERGLKSIPLSVDLWIHYLTYVKTTRGEDEEYVRSQFERAINACGLEFRSDRLWDSYIKWETDAKRVQKVTVLFDRLLTTPTQGYTAHFDNFQEHVSSNNPNKILEVDEFMALRKEVRTLLKNDEKAADNADLPPGDEDSKLYTSDEETKCIRERIVSIRRKIHKTTVNAVTARWNFEEGIKRPYFHVKPLERCQLKNWQEYLDYEIEQGDRTRIIVLFERCLIACALYEEFWLKFVHYLETLKDPEMQPKIRDVYERACTIHHLKKPKLHLQWAVFEEMSDNLNRAAEILVNLEKQVPNVLQVAYRRINLERRRSDFEKCSQLFEHYISNSKNKMISSNIAIKYSRFCLKMMKDFDKAQEILKTAITKDPNNPRLYLQLVDLTLQKENVKEEDVCAVIEEFLEKETADPDQKTLFAQRKLEYLEDFGSSIETVQAAFEQLQKFQKLSKDAIKKKEPKGDSSSSSSSKKEKAPPSSTTQSQSYSNYNYGTSSNQPPYNYSGSQQGQYNYPQYGQAPATGDQQQQYQYQNWQYPQGGAAAAYGGYNQWGGYTGGYSGY